ncbi:hypothetical protein [Thioclava indica]|nr:hypothetical protein [Thioclava indica]
MEAIKYRENLAPRAHEIFAPATLNTLFWRPRWITTAPVMQHVAFLFWLVGAIRPRSAAVIGVGDGAAQFAICQAMDKLNITAQCRGIGFWRDAEADRALVEVPESLREHSALLYDDIAKLQCQGSVSDALTAIAPGSLDLLFLDACNLPAENELGPSLKDWVKCLTPNGVLLVHGLAKSSLNRRNRSEMTDFLAEHATMAFSDEEGLVVAAAQGGQPTPLTTLLNACHNGTLPGETALLFRRLGQGHLAVAEKEEFEASNKKLKLAVSTAKQESDEALKLSREVQEAYEARSQRLSEIQRVLFERESDNSDLTQKLDAALADAAKALAAFDTEKTVRFRETTALTLALDEQSQQTADALAKHKEVSQERDTLKHQLDVAKAEAANAITTLEAEKSTRFHETAALTRKLEDHAQQNAEALAKQAKVSQERDALKQQLDGLQAAGAKALATSEADKQARSNDVAALTEKLENQAKLLKRSVTEGKDAARQVDALKQQLTDALAEKHALMQRVDDLLNSTSWRVTAPLRKIKGGVSKGDGSQPKAAPNSVAARVGKH